MIQTTSTVRSWWKQYRCSSRTDRSLNVADFTMWGKPVGGVADAAAPAFRALQLALEATNYLPLSVWVERLCSQGGIGGKPCQPDGTGCSLHNYRVAVDIDPKQNPQSTGDPFAGRFKPHHIAAVERIRNVHGEQVWAWGGRWGLPDRMHFQINVPPDRTAIDWRTVQGVPPVSDHSHVIPAPIKARTWADESWAWYVENGGTTVPDSRIYETNREDVSWAIWKFVKPMMERMEAMEIEVGTLRRRVQALEVPGVPGGLVVGDNLHVKIERRL